MSNKHNIIALVGMAGAGKSTAAEFFVNKKYDYIRLGQITLDEIIVRKMPPGEASERQVREQLRKDHGMAAFAILNFPKIDSMNNNVVVDGLYSWEEYLAFKERYDHIKVLAICANPEIRYSRLTDRATHHKNDERMLFRSFTSTEARSRDYREIERSNKGGPIAMADYFVINETKISDLTDSLETVYRRLHGK